MRPRTRLAIAALAAVLASSGVSRANTSVEVTTELRDDVDLVPRATLGYRKGRKLKLQVVTIGWAEVEVRTARAFLSMRDAAAVDGIDIWIRNGFRQHEHQEWLYQAYRAGWGNPAARPGYSNHQSGLALDLNVREPETLAWLEANAKRFGFKRTVRSEPWHWEYDRQLAKRMARKLAKARKARGGAVRVAR